MSQPNEHMLNEKQEISIAVMATDIKYIKDSLIKIDQRLDIMDGNYIKRDEVSKMKVDADKTHEDFEERLRKLELNASIFQTQIKTWGAVAILGLGVIQFLIGKFL